MGKQQELVSVIVPVYNLEAYVDRCVDSLLAQNWENLEILLIDDGSTDDSPRMCDRWAEKDSRIRVVHKENAGLGMARNTGIELAKGTYVCFVDGDDTLEPNMIRRACETLRDTSADLVIFGFSDVSAEGQVCRQLIPDFPERVYRGHAVQETFLPDYVGADPRTGHSACVQASAWSCMISMDLIRRENWRFVSEREIISEDYYSMLKLFRGVSCVAVLPEALYRYHRNEKSLSRGYRPDRFDRIKTFYRAQTDLCRRCGYSREVERRCTEPFLNLTIAAMKQEAAVHRDRKLAVERIRQIVSDDLLQQVLSKTRKNKVGIRKKLLFCAMRNHWYRCCLFLLTLRNRMKDGS